MSDYSNAVRMGDIDGIDLAAEREAAAIERLAEWMDDEVEVTDLRRRQEERAGSHACTASRYKRAEAVDAWLRITAAYHGTRCPVHVGSRMHWDTRDDRQRQAKQRAERRVQLQAAATICDDLHEPLDSAAVATLLGMTVSGFYNVARAQLPPVKRVGGRMMFDPCAVASYARRRAGV